MTLVRRGPPGTTRSCPHCRATILDSAARCPQCQKHLRVDPESSTRGQRTTIPFRVEGTIAHDTDDQPAEYQVMLVMHDEKGAEISRQVMAVGAMTPGATRTFTLSVELTRSPRPSR
jgi:glutaredoxin